MYRKSYCNERTMIGKAGQNQIVFTFVTGETVKIQAGDIDPLTGEKIPDEIFAEYHKLRTSEVHRTLKTERVPFTEKELDVRRKEREEIAKEFEETYGYRPTKDNIRFIVPHQANIRIIEAVAKRLEVGMDKVMVNIEHFGNTSAATIPLALWEYEKELKKGDNLILTAFGAGFVHGASYLKWAY